jgi:hypothetical protein
MISFGAAPASAVRAPPTNGRTSERETGGEPAVATKRGRQSGARKGTRTTSKASVTTSGRKLAAKGSPRKTPAKAKAPAAPGASRSPGPGARNRRPITGGNPGPLAERPPAALTLLQRAERLRDDIQRSKLTHPDPWRYTGKARAWAKRAQELVAAIDARGETAAERQAFERFAAEVEADADYLEARRLF